MNFFEKNENVVFHVFFPDFKGSMEVCSGKISCD